jgi:hypothetical protein
MVVCEEEVAAADTTGAQARHAAMPNVKRHVSRFMMKPPLWLESAVQAGFDGIFSRQASNATV